MLPCFHFVNKGMSMENLPSADKKMSEKSHQK